MMKTLQNSAVRTSFSKVKDFFFRDVVNFCKGERMKLLGSFDSDWMSRSVGSHGWLYVDVKYIASSGSFVDHNGNAVDMTYTAYNLASAGSLAESCGMSRFGTIYFQNCTYPDYYMAFILCVE